MVNLNISEKNLISQLKELNKKLKILNDRYFDWYSSTPGLNNIKNPRTYYDNLNEIPLIKRRIKNITYILQ